MKKTRNKMYEIKYEIKWNPLYFYGCSPSQLYTHLYIQYLIKLLQHCVYKQH